MSVFENERVVILKKSTGILSVRSRTGEKSILDQYDKLLPVHRLDRDVEGLLLAAKDTEAQRICNAFFEKREIKKTYWALTCKVNLSIFGKLPFKVESLGDE